MLTPAIVYYDLRTRYRVYEQCEAAEYWIVDTRRRSIEVLGNENGKILSPVPGRDKRNGAFGRCT